MPISLSCGGCDKPYKVKDEFAGRSFKCKNCGTSISVPKAKRKRPTAESISSQHIPRKRHQPALQAPHRSSQAGAKSIGLIAGLMMFIILLLVGGVYLISSSLSGGGSSESQLAQEVEEFERKLQKEAEAAPKVAAPVAQSQRTKPKNNSNQPVKKSPETIKEPDAEKKETTEGKLVRLQLTEEGEFSEVDPGEGGGSNILRKRDTWNVDIQVPESTYLRSDLLPEDIFLQNATNKVHFSSTESPFCFLIGKDQISDSEIPTLVDLRTSEVVQEYRLNIFQSRVARFSADGKYVVTQNQPARKSKSSRRRGRNGRTPLELKTPGAKADSTLLPAIDVYSLESGELLQSIQPFTNKVRITFMDILDSETILIATTPDRSSDPDPFDYFKNKGYKVKRNTFYEYVEVPDNEYAKFRASLPDYPEPKIMGYDISTGEMKWAAILPRKYSLYSFYNENSPRLSPDRRYLILSRSSSEVLMFYDLQNQKIAGGIVANQRKKRKTYTGVKSWGFSKNGKTLAVLVENGGRDYSRRNNFALEVFDLKTGKMESRTEFVASSNISTRAKLEDFDKEGLWLVDQSVIVDSKIKQKVAEFQVYKGRSKLSSTPVWLSGNKLLFAQGESYSSGPVWISSIPILSERFANSLDAVRNGEPSIIEAGSKLGIKIELQNSYLPEYPLLTELLTDSFKKNIEKSGFKFSETAPYQVCFYFGEKNNKKIYRKNKDKISLSVEQQLKSYSVRTEKPNVIIAIESQEGEMIWGTAVHIDDKVFGMDAPEDSTDFRVAKRSATVLKSLLNSISLPIYIPENSEHYPLPVHKMLNVESQ